MVTTSIGGSLSILIPGGIKRFGPIKENGDALLEKIGSVSILILLLWIKNLHDLSRQHMSFQVSSLHY